MSMPISSVGVAEEIDVPRLVSLAEAVLDQTALGALDVARMLPRRRACGSAEKSPEDSSTSLMKCSRPPQLLERHGIWRQRRASSGEMSVHRPQ